MGMMRCRFLLAALLAIVPVPASAQAAAARAPAAAASEDARLARLFAEDSRREDQLNPLAAIYRGRPADAAVFAQLFTDALDRHRLASVRTSLRALERIDRRRLSPERQISFDVMLLAKRQQAAWLEPDMRMLTAVRPLNHFGGLHVEFPTLIARGGALAYADEADYRAALALNAAFSQVLDNAVARMREGLGNGVVESQLTTRNMIVQIDALLAERIDATPFLSPVREFPVTIPAKRQAELRQAFSAVTGERVLPAYRRLRTFLAEEYLPAAREAPGLLAMRGGEVLYRRLIERETTLRLEPEDIHQLGLGEVARIQREMESVRRKLGIRGTLRAAFDTIRVDPRFHPRTRSELADGFAATARKVDAQIPRFFARLPKARLLIEPYPASREKFEAGASYNQGTSDGSRPGVFLYNTYDLPSRFLSGITTLYLHEGIPGHHFQVSLALEDTSLPDFQRFDGNNAFVEGWALYAESLGFEMGLYTDPMQHWGTLDDEMLRAMRLVVDTGIHAKGWSRDQAIAYMLANSGMGRTDATAEVERYIANPAQALSYKIGAMAIQRLRRKAELALGAKFDIRAFHDQVLSSGALPLPVLEAKIEGWIAASR
jgi:uncharacterized protein (DUF885 family)